MKEIEAGITYFRPDVLITTGIDVMMFDPALSVIPELCDKYGMYHIYWATEDRIHFDGISLPFVRLVKPDAVWTIHPDCVAKYRALGKLSDYLNFAFNPRLFPPKPDDGAKKEKYDVALVGTTHLDTRTFRYDSLRQLLFPLFAGDTGIRVDIWGNGWIENAAMIEKEFGVTVPPSCIHGLLPYKETSRVYRQSKIMLGVQNARDQVSQRTFEILGSGAFMIASRTEELERLFEDGKEVVLTSSPEETIERVQYYLPRPEERLQIGRRARAKVMAGHTFLHRLEQLWPAVQQSVNQKRRVT